MNFEVNNWENKLIKEKIDILMNKFNDLSFLDAEKIVRIQHEANKLAVDKYLKECEKEIVKNASLFIIN